MAATKPLPIDPTRSRHYHAQRGIVLQPALARTCRFLRQEGLRIFYTRNVFEMHHANGVPCVRRWLAALRPETRALMRTMVFHAKCVVLIFRVGRMRQC